jgi:hypothetical protein
MKAPRPELTPEQREQKRRRARDYYQARKGGSVRTRRPKREEPEDDSAEHRAVLSYLGLTSNPILVWMTEARLDAWAERVAGARAALGLLTPTV